MKKVYIFLIILFVAIFIIFLGPSKERKEKDILQYINENNFKTISFENILDKIIAPKFLPPYDDYMLESFNLDISKDKKIQRLFWYITRKTFGGYQEICVYYVKESNELQIREFKLTKEDYESNLIAKDFAIKFDSFKEKDILPKGEYDRYGISFLKSGRMQFNTSSFKNYYIFEDNKISELKSNRVDGIQIFILGIPVKNNEDPIRYFIK